MEQSPFGEVMFTTERIEIPIRFPGQYADLESGLSYNYFREYDPSLGRYIQSHPIGLVGRVNASIYVENSPIMRIDPLGLDTYIERVIQNLGDTNKVIPGLAAPVGVEVGTAKITARAIGGVTLMQLGQFIFTGQFREKLAVALRVSVLNFVIVSGLFEVGVVIGSIINATETEGGCTVRDHVSAGFSVLLD